MGGDCYYWQQRYRLGLQMFTFLSRRFILSLYARRYLRPTLVELDFGLGVGCLVT